MKQRITKILLAVLLLGFGLTSACAQQSSLTSGGMATGSGGTVDYSVGQIVYTTDASPAGSMSMGVQQPFEIYALGTNDFPEINVSMVVFPNPTTSLVSLNIGALNTDTLNYQLFDLSGREIFNKKIKQQETQIQFEKFPSSVYFLNVLDRNKTIKTFKIIKK